jgi:hypothetical protein
MKSLEPSGLIGGLRFAAGPDAKIVVEETKQGIAIRVTLYGKK